MVLKALLLTEGVIVATCLSTFVGARQLNPEPSASSPFALSSSSFCSRALATTLWGAAFAFFSLMADAWSGAKAIGSVCGDASFFDRLISLLLIAPVAPFFRISVVLEQMFNTLKFREILSLRVTNPELAADTMSICNKLWRDIDDVLVILFGVNQPEGFLKITRIVANADIVLGVSDSTKIRRRHINTDHSPVNEDNMADALTLGNKTAQNSFLTELNESGKLALLKSSSILPNYKKLRFLDGSSGIATVIIALQAIGYVTSIVYRAIHHLAVSPIEAIGFAYSLLVIFHSLVYNVGYMCQSPLLIYLTPEQEQEMLQKCNSTQWIYADDVMRENAVMVGMVVVASVVMAFTILVEWHVLRISTLNAVGPILFLLSFITQLFEIIICMKHSHPPVLVMYLLMTGSVMISFGGIVVSIVATILNWQSDKFDSRTPSVIHNLPFLG
jgi:hypothetical protein